MEPSDLYNKLIYKWLANLTNLFGANIYQNKWNNFIILLLGSVSLLIFPMNALYTIIFHEKELKLQTIPLCGGFIQGASKLILYICYKNDLIELAIFIGNIYASNRTNVGNSKILLKVIKPLMLLYKIALFIAFMVFVGFIITPFCVWLFTGEILTILPTLSPFIDTKNVFGYIIMFIHDLIVSYAGCVWMSIGETTFLIFCLNAFALSNLFCNSFDKLNEYLVECNKNSVHVNEHRVKFTIRNLDLMHKEYRK